MKRAILLAALLVAGCGRSATATDTVIAGAEDCGKKPAFVPLYADAKVTLCSSNHDDATRKDSGMLLYTSAAAPAAVLAWSKAEALKAGLAERLTTPEMFSAADGEKRNVMVMVASKGDGSQITLNWDRER